jgi:hypothetical protein
MRGARPSRSNPETRVLIGISWTFLVLGSIAVGFFLPDPSIARHPQLLMLGTTALCGAALLRLIARLVGTTRPEE